jgi:hypothetical protein
MLLYLANGFSPLEPCKVSRRRAISHVARGCVASRDVIMSAGLIGYILLIYYFAKFFG